jgi:glyoxylase-like metal-dependent hydrolase (beta-lactamase superfamily II)
MRIGSISIDPVLDGYSLEPIETVVVNADATRWDCAHQPLDGQGRLRLDFGGFLVRSGDRVALVDVGNGPSTAETRPSGGFVDNLRALGVEPGDVTDVLLSHLHRDHIGWASRDGQSVFPNATYRVHEADWELFVSGPNAIRGAQRLLLPVESQLDLFSDEGELLPGVIARPAPGHTPGSTVYLVADGDKRALLMGDAVHTIEELTDPEVESIYDLDRAAAQAVRERFAREAIDEGTLIGAGHFPGLAFGRLIEQDSLRKWAFVS